MKVSLEECIREVEEEIKEKAESNNSQDIDEEILSWISVYRHGRNDYKEIMKKTLIDFFVNSGMVKNRKDIVLNQETNI